MYQGNSLSMPTDTRAATKNTNLLTFAVNYSNCTFNNLQLFYNLHGGVLGVSDDNFNFSESHKIIANPTNLYSNKIWQHQMNVDNVAKC